MTDKGAHPGVRSLLARFENNQNATPSPPPRGRSPVGSDASGAGRRPLSKVSASFIAVDGGSQSSPIIGLRRISGHSDSPPPPARVRSFNSEDLDGSVKSLGSSVHTSNGIGLAPKDTEQVIRENTPTKIVEATATHKVPEQSMSAANKENQPILNPSTLAPPAPASPKPKISVSKRPSTLQMGKSVAASQPSPQALGHKASTYSRTPTSPAKPDNTRPNRGSRPSTTKTVNNDSPKGPTQKPSRTTLNTVTKTSARPVLSSTTAREAVKTASRASDARSRSSTRPTRPPGSATGPSSTSTGKQGAPSTLSRKPSSLRNTGSTAPKRETTPTASSIRKQSSRPSPGQPGNDRPHSRVSNGSSKPVDESFLARMMRPTASSANKAHEKLEIKSPPRGKPTQAPRKVSSRMEIRPPRFAKAKTTSKSSQEEEEAPLPIEVSSESKTTEEEKRPEAAEEPSCEQVTTEISPEPKNDQLESATADETFHLEAPVKVAVETSMASPIDRTENPLSDEPDHAPLDPPAETSDAHLAPDVADEQVEQTLLEQVPEDVTVQVSEDLISPAETPVEQEPEPSVSSTTEIAAQSDLDEAESPDALSEEKAPELSTESAVLNTDSKLKDVDVDVDINKLSLN